MAVSEGRGSAGGVADHGLLGGLGDDDHSIYALLAGRAGGQVLSGGTVAADNLTLRASPTPGAGRILANSPIVFGPYEPTGALYGFTYTATEHFTAPFIGGGLNFSGVIDYTSGTFIYESFRGSPDITNLAGGGFQAYTVLQALPAMRAGAVAGQNPLAPLILNAGVSIWHQFTGTRTVGNCAAVNFASTARTTSTGTLNITNWNGITVAPKWSTTFGSTVNFGTIRGVHLQNPTVAAFGGTSAGTETATAVVGLDVDNQTAFTTAVIKAAVRSAITAATNRYFLLNNGGAEAAFLNGVASFNDGAGVVLGTGDDVRLNWNGSAVEFDPVVGDDFRLAFAAGVHTMQSPNFGGSGAELRLGYDRFAFGQTGAVGNQVGVFVANARATGVGGEWTDFLLTQAGNLTVDHAMGGVFGWTINAPSMTLGTGTVTTAGALNVGGNVNQGSVNRFGVRILSNPSGGSGVNAALWVTAGRSQFDGIVTLPRNTDANRGAAGETGRIIFNTDDGQLNIDDGTNWTLPDGTTT